MPIKSATAASTRQLSPTPRQALRRGYFEYPRFNTEDQQSRPPASNDKPTFAPPCASTTITTATASCASTAVDAVGGFSYSTRQDVGHPNARSSPDSPTGPHLVV